jgi:hypothetical protein
MSGMIQANVPVLDYGQAANRGFLTIFGAVTQAAEQARRSKIEDMMLPLEMRRVESQISQMDASAARMKADMALSKIKADREAEWLNGATTIEEFFESRRRGDSGQGDSGEGGVNLNVEPDLPAWGEGGAEQPMAENPLSNWGQREKPTNPLNPYLNAPSSTFGNTSSVKDLGQRVQNRAVDDVNTEASFGPLVSDADLAEAGGIDDMQTSTGTGESFSEARGAAKLSDWEVLTRKEQAIKQEFENEKRRVGQALASLRLPNNKQNRDHYVARLAEEFQERYMTEVSDPRDNLLSSEISKLAPESQERVALLEQQYGSRMKAFQAYKAEEARATKGGGGELESRVWALNESIQANNRILENANSEPWLRAQAQNQLSAQTAELARLTSMQQGQEAVRRTEAPSEEEVLAKEISDLRVLKVNAGYDRNKLKEIDAQIKEKESVLLETRLVSAPVLKDSAAVKTFFSQPENQGKLARIQGFDEVITTRVVDGQVKLARLDGSLLGGGGQKPDDRNTAEDYSPDNRFREAAKSSNQQAAESQKRVERAKLERQLDSVKKERERLATPSSPTAENALTATATTSALRFRAPTARQLADKEERLLRQQKALEEQLAALENE